MGWFRRKTEVVDAEHLLRETLPGPAGDPGAVQEVGAPQITPGGASEDFRLTVQDVFFIRGRGVVATGQVESGSVSLGSTVSVSRQGRLVRQVLVAGVEMFRKRLNSAVAGQNVGLLLDQVERSDVAAGDVLTG